MSPVHGTADNGGQVRSLLISRERRWAVENSAKLDGSCGRLCEVDGRAPERGQTKKNKIVFSLRGGDDLIGCFPLCAAAGMYRIQTTEYRGSGGSGSGSGSECSGT